MRQLPIRGKATDRARQHGKRTVLGIGLDRPLPALREVVLESGLACVTSTVTWWQPEL